MVDLISSRSATVVLAVEDHALERLTNVDSRHGHSPRERYQLIQVTRRAVPGRLVRCGHRFVVGLESVGRCDGTDSQGLRRPLRTAVGISI